MFPDPDLEIALPFCLFHFLPKEENLRVPLTVAPSRPHFDSELWGAEMIPIVVAPWVSLSSLTRVAPPLLGLSQPSTTL